MNLANPSFPLSIASWWNWFSIQTPTRAWWLAGILAAVAAGLFLWRQWRATRAIAPTGVPGWSPAALIFDLLLVFIAFDLLPGLLSGQIWSPVLLTSLLCWRLTCAGAFGLYWCRAGGHRQLAAWVAGALVFALGAVWLVRSLPAGTAGVPVWRSAVVHGGLVMLAIACCVVRPSLRTAGGEAVRRGLLLALALALTRPWFSPHLVGTGDASLYFETLQDFLNQLRAGIWPPWVSQSEIAPFGAIFPFRFATYHYYFSALINVLTGSTLTTFAVQHLSIVLSFAGGGWVMYAVLRRLCPDHPWLACALAALYIASPAWLGPLYGFSMIFTTMALPFIPLALAGAWPEFGAKTTAQAVLHGAALAAAWHAHMPVGFWVSFAVALAQVASWWTLRPTWAVIGRQALAWVVCGVLCLGLLYSVLSLHFGMPPQIDKPNETPSIMRIIRDIFPANLMPAANTPARLADLQLGYSLMVALLVAIVALVRGHRLVLVWLAPALLLLVLILPFPWLTEHLWQMLPKAVRAMTGPWPVQRIIGTAAAAATLVGALGLARFAGQSRRGRWGVTALISMCLAWSLAEAAKYLRRGQSTVIPASLSNHLLRRENSPLMTNWLAFHNHLLPTVYEAEKIHDARLYNRVWSQYKTRVVAGNYESILATGRTLPAVAVGAGPLVPNVWRLMPGFEFQGGQRYLLELIPGPQMVPGTFIMSSTDFQRTVTTLTPNGRALIQPIWTTPSGPQWTEMVYLPTDPALAAHAAPDFLSYRLTPYNPDTLPVRLQSFAPYRASVSTPEAGWLETHRLFTEGYRARVNGKEVEVGISNDFRVLIPVPAGTAQVQLDYVGPAGLRLTFAVMAAGWALLAIWGLLHLVRRCRPNRPAVQTG